MHPSIVMIFLMMHDLNKLCPCDEHSNAENSALVAYSAIHRGSMFEYFHLLGTAVIAPFLSSACNRNNLVKRHRQT
jgi:hypothetical protein